MEILVLTLNGHVSHYNLAVMLVQKQADWILGNN